MENDPTRDPHSNQDWADKAADLVGQFATTIRRKGVEPLFRLGRMLSYGLIAVLVGTVVLLVTVTVVVRVLTDYAFAHHVWITYLVLGGINLIFGVFLINKMKSHDI